MFCSSVSGLAAVSTRQDAPSRLAWQHRALGAKLMQAVTAMSPYTETCTHGSVCRTCLLRRAVSRLCGRCQMCWAPTHPSSACRAAAIWSAPSAQSVPQQGAAPRQPSQPTERQGWRRRPAASARWPSRRRSPLARRRLRPQPQQQQQPGIPLAARQQQQQQQRRQPHPLGPHQALLRSQQQSKPGPHLGIPPPSSRQRQRLLQPRRRRLRVHQQRQQRRVRVVGRRLATGPHPTSLLPPLCKCPQLSSPRRSLFAVPADRRCPW